MKKLVILLLLCLSSCALSAPGTKNAPSYDAYDISFLARPFKAVSLTPGTRADVLDVSGDPETAHRAVVLLAIEKELKGHLPVETIPVPSKTDQASDAFKKRQFFKLLVMDFESPDEARKKSFMSVAVKNPRKTFNISSGEEKEGNLYRVYLRTLPSQRYEMITALPEHS